MPFRYINNFNEYAKIPSDSIEPACVALLNSSDQLPAMEHVKTIVRDRLKKVIDKTSKEYVNRENEIEAVVASLVSGVSSVLLGPPGTAKSAIVRRIASLCGLNTFDGKYFEYLLTSHTMPEEIFGTIDLNNLVNGKYIRKTDNKLPVAEIAFLDEVFRGGSHILNTLLTIINEKKYDSGEGMKSVPLLGIVGASNNPPVDPELEAFYDRFPIRIWLKSIFDEEKYSDTIKTQNQEKLLETSIDNEVRRLEKAFCEKVETNIDKLINTSEMLSCTNDFRFAKAYLISFLKHNKKAAERRKNQFISIFKLVRNRCKLSDRSLGQLWLWAAAYDFIKGKNISDCYPNSEGHIEVYRMVARSSKDVEFLNEYVNRNRDLFRHRENI